MRNVVITLGEASYVVPHLNLGEIEEIDEVFRAHDQPGLKRSYALLEIMLRRAEPKVEKVRDLETTPREMAKAIDQVLKFSGLVEEGADPNGAAPGEPAHSGETSTDGSKLTPASHRRRSAS